MQKRRHYNYRERRFNIATIANRLIKEMEVGVLYSWRKWLWTFFRIKTITKEEPNFADLVDFKSHIKYYINEYYRKKRLDYTLSVISKEGVILKRRIKSFQTVVVEECHKVVRQDTLAKSRLVSLSETMALDEKVREEAKKLAKVYESRRQQILGGMLETKALTSDVKEQLFAYLGINLTFGEPKRKRKS